ncbi:MAG: hypothetical protein IPI22_11835 [Bacteroidetes bacterium]|nr:hypothetical protein [Bacteroidota bacterium]
MAIQSFATCKLTLRRKLIMLHHQTVNLSGNAGGGRFVPSETMDKQLEENKIAIS